ncbi:hypothetical protein NPIL_74041 [Nephila pilipes]|uniref:Uncharacterized protein n=1 Tax=Nephila pilipes TaxID=299642 RepID=A0A8X6PAW5_NEPPI|nr:hypothetical protein NPIL_74041 [Nephila pilipes]
MNRRKKAVSDYVKSGSTLLDSPIAFVNTVSFSLVLLRMSIEPLVSNTGVIFSDDILFQNPHLSTLNTLEIALPLVLDTSPEAAIASSAS